MKRHTDGYLCAWASCAGVLGAEMVWLAVDEVPHAGLWYFVLHVMNRALPRSTVRVAARPVRQIGSGARPAYITVQLGRGLEVFYRDGATWINDQDDKREMNKIEAPIRPTTPNYP